MENSEKSKEQLLEEIDQLKKKVAMMEKSQENSRLWLENSPVCTKIVDQDFNLQYMSSSGIKELKIDDINKFYGEPYPFYFYPDNFKITMIQCLNPKFSTQKNTQSATLLLSIGCRFFLRL